MDKKISSAVIHRMPRYFRHLCDLQDAGITRISSGTLAERMGLTASQVRQDFNCFGGFGQQGYGYNVAELRAAIAGFMRIVKPKLLEAFPNRVLNIHPALLPSPVPQIALLRAPLPSPTPRPKS